MLIDLHARTRIGATPDHDPRAIIEAARSNGLHGIVFVDHLASGHSRQLLEAGQEESFPVFIGVEIPTTIGQFLCFAPEIEPFMSREEWRQLMPVSAKPTYERVRDLFLSVNGAVLAAHPFNRFEGARLGDRLALCEGLHGVEVLNPSTSKQDCMLAMEMAVKMGLPLAAGSDAIRDLSTIGQMATLLAEPVARQEELVEALRSGNFWAVRMVDSQMRREPYREGGSGQQRPPRSRRPGDSADDRRGPRRQGSSGGDSQRSHGRSSDRRGDGRRRRDG